MGSDMVRASLNGMTPKAQQTASLCWLTCMQMLFVWKGRDPAEIIPALKGAGIDTDDAMKTGLKLKDNRKAGKALGMGATGFGQSLSPYDLKERLKQSPVWTCGKWSNANNTHIVVVTGASDSTIEYYDPWYDVGPWEVSELKSRSSDWFIHGNKREITGTDYALGWYQLLYWKA